jgi:hypothetical protein
MKSDHRRRRADRWWVRCSQEFQQQPQATPIAPDGSSPPPPSPTAASPERLGGVPGFLRLPRRHRGPRKWRTGCVAHQQHPWSDWLCDSLDLCAPEVAARLSNRCSRAPVGGAAHAAEPRSSRFLTVLRSRLARPCASHDSTAYSRCNRGAQRAAVPPRRAISFPSSHSSSNPTAASRPKPHCAKVSCFVPSSTFKKSAWVIR